MNTKYIMIASVVFMGVAGLSATFLPAEILNYAGINSAILPETIVQIMGALYLGFALMNWMAKTVLIGGIYSKPLCLGNFLHFTVAGITLIKASLQNPGLKYMIIAAILYSVFAVLFGFVLITGPAKKIV